MDINYYGTKMWSCVKHNIRHKPTDWRGRATRFKVLLVAKKVSSTTYHQECMKTLHSWYHITTKRPSVKLETNRPGVEANIIYTVNICTYPRIYYSFKKNILRQKIANNFAHAQAVSSRVSLQGRLLVKEATFLQRYSIRGYKCSRYMLIISENREHLHPRNIPAIWYWKKQV